MATVRLTKTRIEALKRKPDEGDTQRLCDTAERGLVIDVTRLGKKVWKHRYKPPGNQEQSIVKFGEFPSYSVEEARRIVQKQKQVLAEGRDPRFEVKKMTVEELYIKMKDGDGYFKSEATRKGFTLNLRKWMLPILGGYDVTRIRRVDVRGVLDRILSEGKEGACRITHANMKMLFKESMSRGDIEANPAAGIKMIYTKSGTRERYLSTEEIAAVMNLVDTDPTNLLLKFLLLSGCRLNEARQLRWEDVRDGIVHFPVTKTDPHSLPILPLLEKVLGSAEKLSGRRGMWVFNSQRHVRSPVGEEIVRSRLCANVAPDVTPHALRHTLATLMDELEIPMERVSRVLNHRLPGMSAKYTHSKSLGKKGKALKKYYRRIESIMNA